MVDDNAKDFKKADYRDEEKVGYIESSVVLECAQLRKENEGLNEELTTCKMNYAKIEREAVQRELNAKQLEAENEELIKLNKELFDSDMKKTKLLVGAKAEIDTLKASLEAGHDAVNVLLEEKAELKKKLDTALERVQELNEEKKNNHEL